MTLALLPLLLLSVVFRSMDAKSLLDLPNTSNSQSNEPTPHHDNEATPSSYGVDTDYLYNFFDRFDEMNVRRDMIDIDLSDPENQQLLLAYWAWKQANPYDYGLAVSRFGRSADRHGDMASLRKQWRRLTENRKQKMANSRYGKLLAVVLDILRREHEKRHNNVDSFAS